MEQMAFDILARDRSSAVLATVGRNVDKLGDQIDALGRKEAKPRITLDGDRAKTKVDEFNRALADISNKRVQIDVDVAGRAEVGELRRELSYMTDRKVKVRVDTADSNQRLKTITDRLRLITDTKAKVDVTVTGDRKLDDLVDKMKRIGDFSPVKVKIDLDGGADSLATIRSVLDWLMILDGYVARPLIELRGTGNALADLAAIRAALRGIAGNTTTATVTVRQEWDRTIEARLSGLIGNLLKIPAAAAAGSAAVGVLGASVFSLVGGLAEAGGAALILPGAFAAVGAVVGTVKLGVQGLGDAFKAVADGDPKKLAEAMKGLSTEGRSLVTEVGRLKPAWEALQLDVQGRLLAGLGTEAKQLGAAYLPSLRSGLTGIAMELNSAARGVADFAETGPAVARVDSIFRSTRLAVQDVAPAARDVYAALLDVGEVGASMLPELTSGAQGAAAGFRQFIAEARESGQLKEWIQTGIDRVQQLGSVAGNVGGIVAGIYTAANASGADFLTLLDRGTQAVDDFVHSAEGQDTLRAFFEESRQTVDALVPGLIAAKNAAVGFVQGFNNTDGMARFATAVSDAAETVGPLVAKLGELAGGTLGVLGASLSNVATLLSPVVSGIGGLLDVLGPVGPAILGMITAFAGMRLIAGYVTAVSTSMAAGAVQAGVYTESMLLANGATAAFAASAGSRVMSATAAMATGIGAAAKALPLLAVGFVAISAAADAFATHTEENVQQVIAGHLSMSDAIATAAERIDANGIDWLGGADAERALAMATAEANEEFRRQYDALSPFEKLQADVAMARRELNDALASGDAEGAAVASGKLRDAEARLADVEDDAAKATKGHADAVQELGDRLREQAGTHLAYEEAVQRTADAEREAADALKAHGEKSGEYATEVRDLATAFLAQADAAKAQAEATGGAAAGNQAYIQELLRLNDGTRSGRDALLKLAEGFDRTTLDGISAAAAATGLNTEIVKLPDGREIKLVVAADAAAIPTVQQQLEDFASREYIGTVKINGDPKPFGDMLLQSVTLANGQIATMKLTADGTPVSVVVEGQKYLIDNTTGTLKILGDPAPGIPSLDGFVARINDSGGIVGIDGNPQPGEGQLQQFIGKVNTSRGVATIDGDATLFRGVTTAAVKFADGSVGTVSIDGNQQPVNGKIQASVTYANGSVGTITLAAADGLVRAAQANAKLPLNTTWTPTPNTGPVDAARTNISRPISVDVVYRQRVEGTAPMAGGPARGGFALGGIVAPGGVQLYGQGGTFMGRRLTPMATGQAAVVPPNTWRVVGDRSDVPEAYIPMKRGDDRANRLLDITARALGRTLLPMALGGVVAFAPGGINSPAPVPAAASSTVAPVIDPAYAEALKAAAAAGTALDEVQHLVVDTATELADQAALTTEQVAALTSAAQEATTTDQAYQVGLGALRLAADTVTAAAQTRTAAEQVATEATAVALGQAQAYTGGLSALGTQAGGATTGGVQTLTGAVQGETGTEATALGQSQAYTGGLAALGGQAGGATTAGVQTLTGAVTGSGQASVTATGQAQGHTTQLGALGTQAGGGTAAGLQGATAAAQAQAAASQAAGAQAQGQSGDLQALATSAGTAATQLQGVATAVNNLPDGEFVVTATGRLGAITGSPTVQAATGGVWAGPGEVRRYADAGIMPGYTPGRDVHRFFSPTAGFLELSGGEPVMRPEFGVAVGPSWVHGANAAARSGGVAGVEDFLARTLPRPGNGDGSTLATGGMWQGPGTVRRYALGGVIAQQGDPFPPMPPTLWDSLAEQMADRLTPTMQAAVKAEEEKRAGGPVVEWARTQAGKPYQWGAVGPGSYDCSGFVSACLNVLEGKPPHSRRGTTGSFPWAGFKPGYGRFTVGSSKSVNGGAGHMAAQVNGTNLESSGSVGVRVGGGARGPGDAIFNTIASVARGGILPSFDQGGIASGKGLMLKDIIRPERILTDRQTAAFERLVDTATTPRVRLGAEQVVRGTASRGGDMAGAMAAAVQSRVNEAVGAVQAMAAEMLSRPAITVNDVSGNPTETARAVQVAHRLARR